VIGFYEKSPNNGRERKMSKYVPAKNIVRTKDENKLSEGCHTRRVNSSISNISNSHRVNSSKSKTKKKKKKPAHMKSHSNIPVYQDVQISGKASAKKQFSDSKSKK
jgi:hypothetical protein